MGALKGVVSAKMDQTPQIQVMLLPHRLKSSVLTTS